MAIRKKTTELPESTAALADDDEFVVNVGSQTRRLKKSNSGLGGGGAGDVSSVFSRVGAVVSADGDYEDGQITAAASASTYTPTEATVEGHLAGIDAARRKNNPTATAAPGVGDDSDDGYGVGSVWIDVSADDGYLCLDATVGAAVWKKTTGSGTDLVLDLSPQLGADLDTNDSALVTLANKDLFLLPNGTGAISVSGTTNYENNVTSDDDIPNKKFNDDTYRVKEEAFIVSLSDETTDLTVGTGKAEFRFPYAFTITAVRASVTTAPTGSTITVDINEAGVSILSTKLTIDATEKTSTTAATPAVISDSSIADDGVITFDIDQIGATVAGAGLKVAIIGERT